MRYEVILDAGETPNKCTIAPLACRSDFKLMGVVRDSQFFGPLRADILLHPEGECLTRLREALQLEGIAAIDCVWKRLPTLLRRIQGQSPRLARIPEGFVTSYPRRSDLEGRDPPSGLATIEAIFTAAALLGNWDESLLSKYHFGRAYVECNAELFVRLGVPEASDTSRWPVMERKARNSAQRRADRQRVFPAGVDVSG